MVSVLAEKNSPNKRTIALVNKQNYSILQSSLKIDDLVDPRLTTISTILKHVHKGTIETVYTLLDGEYEFIEAEVLETSELISKSIKDSNLPNEIRIGAVVRKKEVIISSGFNVYPNEIEEYVSSHPGILECGVIGKEDKNRGESIILYAVRHDEDLSESDIIEFCKKRYFICQLIAKLIEINMLFL